MKHIDSELHVRGESLYTDDVPAPAGMLHAAVFYSSVAHGKILSLDISKARSLPGVVAVYTQDDIPGEKYIGPTIQDELLLTKEIVSFVGQPIAVVVAETPELAAKGVAACSVEIEPLPAVFCPREAYALEQWLQAPKTYESGDVDAAFAKCDMVVEGSCEVGGQEHLYLETNRARAIPVEENAIQVYSSTQSPASLQKAVARVLGLAMHEVEVDVKRLGGGFGGKEEQGAHWACMAALAASDLKRPVQLVLNRVDDLQLTGKRHPYKQDFKIGLSAEGKILAFTSDQYQDSGAFLDLSSAVLERTLVHITNAYFIPNVRVMGVCCKTNLPPNTAFRGFGGPQGIYTIEAAIAKAADVMGVPATELQRKNLLSDGDHFYYGQPVIEGRAIRSWDEAEEAFSFSATQTRIDAFNAKHAAKKKGFAVTPVCFGISFTKTFLNQGNSLVHVYTDGSVSVATGGIEMGQGISSNMAAIAAKTFGIDFKRVKVNSTNTTRIANMSPSAASATTDLNGNATVVACKEILKGMYAEAASALEAKSGAQITIEDEWVYVDGVKSELSWEALVAKTYFARKRLSAHGFYSTPGIHFDSKAGRGSPFLYYVYGTCAIEVTVDCLLGTYTIDSAKVMHDMGRPIIETVDRGQVEGGLAQGIGWMTLEELAYKENGYLASHALSTYKAPDIYFMPDDLEVKFLEDADNDGGPLKTKAVGEPPFNYGIAAFFALRNAIKAFNGRDDLTLISPMTPERALTELYQASVPDPKVFQAPKALV